MEMRASSEAASWTSQEFPNNLWNPKVHYCIHITRLLGSIQSQINLVHTIPFPLHQF
jgi:hypothetical protein